MTIRVYGYFVMKKILILGVALAAAVSLYPAGQAEANTGAYYYVPTTYQPYQPVVTPTYTYGGNTMNEEQMIAFLKQLIVQLQAQLEAKKKGGYTYYNPGYTYSYGYVVGEPRSGSSRRGGDEEPEVETESAKSIKHDSAELRGFVDMMDFEDGEVFFVYGTDEDDIEEVEDDFDSYRDVDTNGQRLQKVRVDSSFDGDDDFEEVVTGLRSDTDYYFQICVGFEDEDDDEVILCGGVEEFTTKKN